MKPFTIHKPTHKWFTAPGTLAVCIGQKRGDIVYLNRIDPLSGKVMEKCRAIGLCAGHLTGYGKGVKKSETLARESMQRAWRYMFGPDIPAPTFCDKVES